MPNTKMDQARSLATGVLDHIDVTLNSDADRPLARGLNMLALAMLATLDAIDESVAATAPTERQPPTSSGETNPDAGTILEAIPPTSAPPPGLYGAPRNADGTSAAPAPHAAVYEQRRNEDGSVATE